MQAYVAVVIVVVIIVVDGDVIIVVVVVVDDDVIVVVVVVFICAPFNWRIYIMIEESWDNLGKETDFIKTGFIISEIRSSFLIKISRPNVRLAYTKLGLCFQTKCTPPNLEPCANISNIFKRQRHRVWTFLSTDYVVYLGSQKYDLGLDSKIRLQGIVWFDRRGFGL